MSEEREYIEITISDILEEYLEDTGLSQNGLARELGVPPTRINQIMLNKRSITADTDLRLCKFFNKTDGFFLRLQDNLELRKTKQKIEKELDAIVPYKRYA